MTYLEYYEHCAKKRKMPRYGLCGASKTHWDSIIYISSKQFRYIKPTYKDKKQLIKEGKSFMWWGSDSRSSKINIFTPLRRNLLLLMACLNNEL